MEVMRHFTTKNCTGRLDIVQKFSCLILGQNGPKYI